MTGILALIAALTLYSRKAFFGSNKSAGFFYDLSSDPLERLRELFSAMVKAADAPVCIFVDDLDRCQNSFVVDFLEGIQTSFRDNNVAFVVAADKYWIKNSFEDVYPTFCANTTDKSQPLGYLFLKKIFQLNVPLPTMGNRKQEYISELLQTARRPLDDPALVQGHLISSEQSPDPDTHIDELKKEIEKLAPEGLTPVTTEWLSGQFSHNADMQAALAQSYTESSDAQKQAEHFLLEYHCFLPNNPRVIKRSINAFGMRVATTILEGGNLDNDVLARWTILEQCYPAVADELAQNPKLIERLLDDPIDSSKDRSDKGGQDADSFKSGLSEAMAYFKERPEAMKLLGENGKLILTPQIVGNLIGCV